ncbi:MAG: hypothetical protein AAF573_09110, partial [Bacteroidota bacterium]
FPNHFSKYILMRNLLIVILTVCAFSLSIQAQEKSEKNQKNMLKYGYGSTWHSNEMVGNYQYGEYTRFLGKRFAVGALAGYLNADNFSDGNVTDYAFEAWKGDLNLYLLPIKNSDVSLKIGGGGSYWIGEFRSKDSTDIDFTVTDEENYGWNITVEFEVYIVNTLAIGARTAFTKSVNEENYYFFGLNAGFKF